MVMAKKSQSWRERSVASYSIISSTYVKRSLSWYKMANAMEVMHHHVEVLLCALTTGHEMRHKSRCTIYDLTLRHSALSQISCNSSAGSGCAIPSFFVNSTHIGFSNESALYASFDSCRLMRFTWLISPCSRQRAICHSRRRTCAVPHAASAAPRPNRHTASAALA